MTPQASHRLIYSAGTQVVIAKDVLAQNERIAHPAGVVGVVVQAPIDRTHAHRVKFADGLEAAIHHDQLTRLADYKRQQTGASDSPIDATIQERIIYRCVIRSRAYGLDGEESDTDRRGIYLPTAEMHWSLYGVPEQLENDVRHRRCTGSCRSFCCWLSRPIPMCSNAFTRRSWNW